MSDITLFVCRCHHQATDRLKTEEEIAQEEKEKLEKLEVLFSVNVHLNLMTYVGLLWTDHF